jgi:hypothetical protein
MPRGAGSLLRDFSAMPRGAGSLQRDFSAMPRGAGAMPGGAGAMPRDFRGMPRGAGWLRHGAALECFGIFQLKTRFSCSAANSAPMLISMRGRIGGFCLLEPGMDEV